MKINEYKLSRTQSTIMQITLFVLSSILFLLGSLTKHSNIMSPIAFAIFCLELIVWHNNRYNFKLTYFVILFLIILLSMYILFHKGIDSTDGDHKAALSSYIEVWGIFTGIMMYGSIFVYVLISKFVFKQKWASSFGWGIVIFITAIASSGIFSMLFLSLMGIKHDEVNIALTLIMTILLILDWPNKIVYKFKK